MTFYPSKRTVSNRLMKAAMTERLSSWSPVDAQARGVPSLELINLYRTWCETEVLWHGELRR